ncbi:hypothetical protein EDB81DRAFT_129499 [Dactylonectria macrodidyma]|uniref:Heterokaryon incompatibility domain-containing protein n=1 Tax=Dactylonectria macrodidyma TaxID=307937 RepID=A0A9P9IU15_9HYPO|nr:hypothetical protein EDB81DRAFT_129499 [Dactylonectria macrodidyma]
MRNDMKSQLGGITAGSTEALYAKILDTQRRAQLVQQKTAMRLCVQVDLSTVTNIREGTNPVELRHHKSEEYIAVSCPWSLPGHDKVSGRYRFAPVQPPGVIMAPDIVLERILNFKICNSDYLDTPFWVDKLCINQDASDEKEMAVHSMDLVYQYSGKKVVTDGQEQILGCSLGLLFVEITTVAQLTMLRKLLDSKFAENNDNAPRLLVPVDEAIPVLELIEAIIQDSWWHRAWIFQEEFLASRHMVLLLPCTLDRTGLFENEDGVDLFGKTSGEIEVRPLNFRTEVTVFCLALSRHVDKSIQERCFKILTYARRYTFLYRCKYSAGPSSVVHAMSPAIFEDISTRGITVPSDILAIAANCCRYTSRLNAQILNSFDESLSIAILALFVMNGEIFRQDAMPETVMQQNILECLRTAKLRVIPPLQAAELIFIKMCRLPTVKMSDVGLTVRGALSRLDKRIKVKISTTDEEFYWKTNDDTQTNAISEGEQRLLVALEGHLKSIYQEGGRALHSKVREFLDDKKARTAPQFWSQQHIQVMMAKAVCRAIVERRPLWLSRLHVPRKWTPWLGIFIPDDPLNESGHISFAFTAMQTDHEFKDRGAKLARKNTRVTSLEVRFNPGPRQIMPRKWMNGLCFFNNKDHPSDLTIPWPKWMKN